MWPHGMKPARQGTGMALGFPITDPACHDSQAFCHRGASVGERGRQRAGSSACRSGRRGGEGSGRWGQKALPPGTCLPFLSPKEALQTRPGKLRSKVWSLDHGSSGIHGIIKGGKKRERKHT